jgi:hypothetical protein
VRQCLLNAMGGLDPLTRLRRVRVTECHQFHRCSASRLLLSRMLHVWAHLGVIVKS